MVDLVAIATRGRISPPGNAPNLVAIATRGFVIPSAEPGPEPEPAAGRVVGAFELDRGAPLSFRIYAEGDP